MPKGPFKRTLKWETGDLFALPLIDGTYGVAQAIAPAGTYAIDFALLATRLADPAAPLAMPSKKDAVGLLATWRTVVTGGHWAYCGHADLVVPAESCLNQQLIAQGRVGITHSSWGLLEKFLSAYHGVFPWNLYPAFDFDSYLLDGICRPQHAKILTAAEIALASAFEKERSHPND